MRWAGYAAHMKIESNEIRRLKGGLLQRSLHG
jgi:hypothetical protein